MFSRFQSGIAFLFLLFPFVSNAQSLLETQMNNPITPNNSLFSIGPDQYNHHFEYALPNEGKLYIDFLRLGDWGNENQLASIAAIAAKQEKNLSDSFKYAATTKTLELNVPIDGKTIAINFDESPEARNQLAYINGNYTPLKTGMDTIRVIRNIGIRSKPIVDSGLIQVQYTFVLKDISDIETLAADPAFLINIGNQTDSLIHIQRKKWHRQDAAYHRMELSKISDSTAVAVVKKHDVLYPGVFRNIGISVAFGAIVYDNIISPYADVTYAYLLPTRGKMRGFVGINFNGWGYLSQKGFDSKNTYSTINAEFGFCNKGNWVLQQKTSLLIGLAVIRNENPILNIGFNFGVNSFTSFGFSAATNFKQGEKKLSLITVQCKFNL
jgi:hypothetical protein